MLVPTSGDSARFTQIITGSSGATVAQMDVLSEQTVIASYPVSAFTVTASRSASRRRTATISVPILQDPTVVPITPTSPLAPFGNEVRLRAGIMLPGGVPDLVPCGTFTLVTAVTKDSSSNLSISLTASDRSWLVSQHGFRNAYTIPTNTTLDVAIGNVLMYVYGVSSLAALPFPVSIPPTSYTVPSGVLYQGADPWASIVTLAQGAGWQVYFDVTGVLTAGPVPDPDTQAPVWAFTEGTPTAAQSTTRTWTRSGIANDFIVYNTSSYAAGGFGIVTSGPIVGEAKDTNPASPTYVSGKYGVIPKFTNSTLVFTDAQAQAAAELQLTLSRGSYEALSITAKPDPRFQVDDVVSVTRARQGLNGNYVVDTVDFVAGYSGSTTLTCRRVL